MLDSCHRCITTLRHLTKQDIFVFFHLNLHYPTEKTMSSSSAAASDTQDDQIDVIADITHCICILLQTQKMTHEHLDAVARHHKYFKKNIARLVTMQ